MEPRAAFRKMEKLVDEHIADPNGSSLALDNPGINKYGRFFTRLPLETSFAEMNGALPIERREHVPLSFHEVRHVFNLAQTRAIADTAHLLTFDGDKTLYDDRSAMNEDSPLVEPLLDALCAGKNLALVTAVGSPDPGAYEDRLAGLLAEIRRSVRAGQPDPSPRLFVVGGQCNYLFRCERGRLVPVPDEEWKDPLVSGWDEADVRAFLDKAADSLVTLCKRFQLEVTTVKKKYATGVLYVGNENPSVPLFLDEIAFEIRDYLQSEFSPSGLRLSSGQTGSLPFCTFNGGRDVFVDVGSKAVGIRSLQKYLGLVDEFFTDDLDVVEREEAPHTLHFGDQFTRAGNDLLARKVASTVWVSEPSETVLFLRQLLDQAHTR